MKEMILIPLVRLLHDHSTSVQVLGTFIYLLVLVRDNYNKHNHI